MKAKTKDKADKAAKESAARSQFDPLYKDLHPLFNFLEISPIYMHVYCNDKIIYANQALLDRVGYSLEEALQMNFWDPVYPESVGMVKSIGRARQRGLHAPRRTEFRVATKSGQEVWLDVFTRFETINGQRFVLVGGYDITDRKRAEAELQQTREGLEQRVRERTVELQRANETLVMQQQMLMGIVSNITNGVMIINSQGIIEFCNPTTEQMLKLSSDQIIRAFRSGKLEIHSPSINKMLHEQTAFRDEEVVISYGRKEQRFLISGTPIKDNEGVLSKGVVVLRSLTEVHQLVNRFSGAVARFRFENILTQSEIMTDTISTAKMASRSMSNVLIEGESGTGKELLAQSIHNYSPRAEGPFVAVNCGAIPRELIGSELFGYEEGAFTGARKGGNPGKFELAEGGTLFLDEIGDMSMEHQVTLLRVLQEKQLSRIGGSKVIPVNVRIICATNRNLYTEVQNGRFRQDLYYRLNVISLRIPPLRERTEDIPLLMKDYLGQMDSEQINDLNKIDPAVWRILMQYDWPGNVRELHNLAERLAYTQKNSQITPEMLPPEFLKSIRDMQDPALLQDSRKTADMKSQLANIESSNIETLLRKFNGNVTQVARELGVSRRTIHRKINRYQISRK